MPITGISTLSILLIGQMIDLEADKATGKWGVAVRLGNKTTAYIYLVVQILLCLNVLILTLIYLKNAWYLLTSLIPYILLFTKIIKILLKNYNKTESLKEAARLNVLLHLLFSFLLISALTLMLIL